MQSPKQLVPIELIKNTHTAKFAAETEEKQVRKVDLRHAEGFIHLLSLISNDSCHDSYSMYREKEFFNSFYNTQKEKIQNWNF